MTQPQTDLATEPEARILVVDDEPSIVDLLREALRYAGFSVTSTDNGPDAVRLARESRPDLIVLDVMMPGRDGFEVLRTLKAQPETAAIPVVLLTAKATDSDVWEGWKSGADYYMTKPFNPEDLARFANHVLGYGDI